MHCNICGSDDALVRFCELETAMITGRAHVDCSGHSQYRHMSKYEITKSRIIHTEKEI